MARWTKCVEAVGYQRSAIGQTDWLPPPREDRRNSSKHHVGRRADLQVRIISNRRHGAQLAKLASLTGGSAEGLLFVGSLEELRQIAGAVKDAMNVDGAVGRQIEDDVRPFNDRAQTFPILILPFSSIRSERQPIHAIAESTEEAISSVGTLLGNIRPDRIEIFPSCRRKSHSPHTEESGDGKPWRRRASAMIDSTSRSTHSPRSA